MSNDEELKKQLEYWLYQNNREIYDSPEKREAFVFFYIYIYISS